MKFNITRIVRVISLMTIILSFVSCYKDKGTYTLSPINEVSITTADSSFKLFPGDTLNIETTLSYSLDKNGGDTSRYSYRWYYHRTPLNEDYGGDQISRTISTEKNLHYKVALSFGFWDIYCTVTDKSTQVQFVKKILLEVLSNRLKGWMVLSETGGDPRLDMVSYDAEGTDSVIFDILGFRQSNLTLTGTALDLFAYQGGSLYISTTGNGTVWIDPLTFQMAPSSRLKYITADPSAPDNFYAETMAFEAFYSQGNFYTAVADFYGLPVNKVVGETDTFNIAPYVALPPGVYGSQYIYDLAHKRFLEVQYDFTYCRPMDDGDLFSWTTGKDLMFMTYSRYNGAEVFAVLKDPATSKCYLARWKGGSYSGGDQLQTYYSEMTSATNITQAEHFTVNSPFGYVFYSVGGKLYEYDMGFKTSKLMADYSPKQITRIGTGDQLWNLGDDFYTKQIVVATYDPSAPIATSGTLETFDVPALNGNLVKTGSFTGFGKIKDITYKE
jgi:hypothetical protein